MLIASVLLPSAASPDPINRDSSTYQIAHDSYECALALCHWIWIWLTEISAGAYFNSLTAGATVAMAVFSYFLWKINKEMVETDKRTNRPWILIGIVTGGVVGENPDGNVVFEVGFDFTNTGQSPGMIKTRIAGFRLTDDIKKLPPELNYGNVESDDAINMLGASQKMSVPSISKTLLPRDSDDIRDGKKTLIFLGRIEYRDFLDQSQDHETRFCFFYQPPYRFHIEGTDRAGNFYFAGPAAYNRCT